MRTVESLSAELNRKLSYITRFEKTKILVMVDRIITKSYTNHRLDLYHYSVRYKADEKMVYVYNKNKENTDDYVDYDYVDKIDFPEDFNIKITIDSTMELFIRSLKSTFRRIKSLIL